MNRETGLWEMGGVFVFLLLKQFHFQKMLCLAQELIWSLVVLLRLLR